MRKEVIRTTETQRSEEWLLNRLGVITASECSQLLAGEKTATFNSYINSKVAEIATGEIQEAMSNKAMEWGIAHEKMAVAAVQMYYNIELKEVPLIYRDSTKRCGASADAISIDEKIGAEIKCPFSTKNFIEFALSDKIPSAYQAQCQFQMYVTGLDRWIFAMYDCRMKNKKLHTVIIEKDLEYERKIDQKVQLAIRLIDDKASKLGCKFGEQWGNNE